LKLVLTRSDESGYNDRVGSYVSKRKTIGIRALKNNASRVIEEVAERKEEYVVTDRGRPVAVLRPWGEEDRQEDHAARVAEVMKEARDIAARVAAQAAANGNTKSAADVVSEQRR
jgi:prevent-host-death family protein